MFLSLRWNLPTENYGQSDAIDWVGIVNVQRYQYWLIETINTTGKSIGLETYNPKLSCDHGKIFHHSKVSINFCRLSLEKEVQKI